MADAGGFSERKPHKKVGMYFFSLMANINQGLGIWIAIFLYSPPPPSISTHSFVFSENLCIHFILLKFHFKVNTY